MEVGNAGDISRGLMADTRTIGGSRGARGIGGSGEEGVTWDSRSLLAQKRTHTHTHTRAHTTTHTNHSLRVGFSTTSESGPSLRFCWCAWDTFVKVGAGETGCVVR